MQFVVSYPKSGNTWVRLMAAAYNLSDEEFLGFMESHSAPADLPGALRYTDVERYQYQTISPFPIDEIGFANEARMRPAAMLVLRRELSASTHHPTLVKSHNLCGTINGIDLWNSNWADRVVNPVRDPREICCSFSVHRDMDYKKTAEFMADSKARMGEDGKRLNSLLGTWSTHVKSWLNEENIPVHTVRYEDLQADPFGEFYDIMDFLGAPDLTEDRVEEAVQQTQFDRMQELESKYGFHEKTADQGQFFRSGKTDGWKDELPANVARKIEEDHGDVMERLGYL